MKFFRAVSAFIVLSASLPAFAGISFGSPDLNGSDEVLFSVRQTLPGTVSYRSLFYVSLRDGQPASEPQVLTCYPEQMELLCGGSILQIRNRYGRARYSLDTERLEWVERTSGMPLNSMRLSPRSVSPDGKWSCYISKTGYAEGRLVFESSDTGRTVVLDDQASFSYDSVPVKWAPDSTVFLYSKEGVVYFSDPEAAQNGVQMDEKFREIGKGSIASVCWAGSSLYYIDSDMVYKIDMKGLYTAGLYSGIIGKGFPCGRLPEHFNPDADIFSVNSGETSLFLIKAGRIFSYYMLRSGSCSYLDVVFSRPYTNGSGSLLDAVVLWSSRGEPYVWMRLMPYAGGKVQASVYKITDSFTPVLSVENSCRPVISSDGTLAAFFSGSTVYVYNVSTFSRVGQISGENMVSAVWAGNTVLYVGGERSVRKWNVANGKTTTLFLSSAAAGIWDKKSGQIEVSSSDGTAFLLDKTKRIWTRMSGAKDPVPVNQNGRYRVFCGTTPNTLYENALYVRTLSGKAVTRPVYAESVVRMMPRRKAAFVFDAYDSADGLPEILSALAEYNIPGTFCINGEFIRRYPSETKQIASTRNRCASLFFSTVDLTGTGFIADENFIRRGLARNEDEFFQCTGSELSLLWHAPYYHAADYMQSAGKNAGYAYIHALQDEKYSEMTFESCAERNTRYYTAAQIIDRYLTMLKRNGGGIIPVTVGYAHGQRTDYLYNNMDLLVSAVLDEGFDIVNADEIVN